KPWARDLPYRNGDSPLPDSFSASLPLVSSTSPPTPPASACLLWKRTEKGERTAMRRPGASQLNQWRWWTAGGVLLAGGAWAAQLYHAPASGQGPDSRELRALAQRLDEVSAAPPAPELKPVTPP